MSQHITSCKNCAFAVYNDILQTGCELDRLDAIRKSGIEPLKAYDESKQFFIIPGMQCMFKRSHTWRLYYADNHNLFEQALDTIPFPYHVVIMGGDHTGKILSSIQSVSNQTLPPAKITVIRPYGTISDLETIKLYLQDNDIPWKLENILNPELTNITSLHQLVLTTNKSQYVLFMNAGARLSDTTLETIKNKVYIDLLQFSAIIHDCVESVIFMAFDVWKYIKLTTSIQNSIIQNIMTLNKEEGKDPWANIYRIMEIVPTALHPRLLSYTPATN